MISKPILKEYDPIIYPRKVLVCLNANKKFLESKFKFYSEISDDLLEAMAISSTCQNLIDDKGGILVWTTKSSFSINTIAHESVHVANYIFEYIGEESKSDECYAYLVGWIAECIDKTIKK